MPVRNPHHAFIATALKAVLVAAMSGGLQAAQAETDPKMAKGKEKCFGVAKAGENGCQAVSGSHTCGGSSRVDYRGEDWKWVPSGTCLTIGGQLQSFEGYGKRAVSMPVAPLPTPSSKKP